MNRRRNPPPPLNTNLTNNNRKATTGSAHSADLDKLELPCSVRTPRNPASKPPVRGFHTCTLVANRLYIIGGDNRQTEFSDVCIFDLGKYLANCKTFLT